MEIVGALATSERPYSKFIGTLEQLLKMLMLGFGVSEFYLDWE